MPRPTTDEIIRFGNFELNVKAGELRRRGVRLPVQGRPVMALTILLRNPGQLVTREEFREELWPTGTFVDFDHGLHNAVARIRAVLGDTGDVNRFIETVPRRGYRFIGHVEVVPPVAAPAGSISTGEGEPAPAIVSAITGTERSPEEEDLAPRSLPHPTNRVAAFIGVFAISATLLVLGFLLLRGRNEATRIDSVAVLPLHNLSGDPDQDYFADGLTDAFITELVRIKALRVVSRTSVLRYKVTTKSAPVIARELNVQAILEGAVEKVGDRVRISARLINAHLDKPVWAETYDRDLKDVLRLQAEVASSVASQIRVELTPDERAHWSAVRQVNSDAYLSYLKGRYFWGKRSRESVHKAIDYFNQAIDKDPQYAASYSGLADCYSSLGFSFDVGELPPAQAQPKATAAALRAIQLDPSLAEAHTSLGFIKFTYGWDWAGAEQEFRRGIALNPNAANGHHWYAHYLLATGRTRDAEEESRTALKIEPLSLIYNVHLAWLFNYSRRYDEALDQVRKALETDADYGLAHWYGALAYEQKKMYSEALREMHRAQVLLPENTVLKADLGHLYAVAGERSNALTALEQLKRQRQQSYVSNFETALIYLGLGNTVQALAEIEKAFEERSDMLVYLSVDPRLDGIRSDPKFQALLLRMRTPLAQR